MSTENLSVLPPGVYEQLPATLRLPCMAMPHTQDREIFLLAALGLYSGITTTYTSVYNDNSLYPNLYCFIADDTHSAGRVMKYMQIYINELYELFQSFIDDLYDKDDKPLYEHLRTSVPGNINYNSLLQEMAARTGNAFIWEPKGNVQTNGAFCKLLSNAFLHEPIIPHNAQSGKTLLVNKPAVSLITKGSTALLKQLSVGNEPSLFHAMLCYDVQDNPTEEVYFNEDTAIKDVLIKAGEVLSDIYLEMSLNPASMVMNEAQQQMLIEYYKELKSSVTERYGVQAGSIAYSRSVKCFRLAMVLTALFYIEEKKVFREEVIYCTDVAMQLAITLSRHYEAHSDSLYAHMVQKPVERVGSDEPTEDERQQVYELFCKGISLRKIAVQLYHDENKHMKVKRMLKKYYGV